MEKIKQWFKIYQSEFNLFEISSLNKRFGITLLASDTNHSGVIVRYCGCKYHLSTFENTCQRM